MTLIIQKPTGAKVVLRKGWQPMDSDAAAYITAVETADGQALEEKTKIAIDNFVLGCKTDGIWSAIKASCILAGARTLTGALVPLVGAAPTNVGGLFVSGDYNRKTGLIGNGSSKYLDSNFAQNNVPDNNAHLSVYVATAGTAGNNSVTSYANARDGSSLLAVIRFTNAFGTTATTFYNRTNAALVPSGDTLNAIGFMGTSRSSNTVDNARINQQNFSRSGASFFAAGNSSVALFAGNNTGVISGHSNVRLAFYSIGESLNLAALDARVTDLINAFGAAIP